MKYKKLDKNSSKENSIYEKISGKNINFLIGSGASLPLYKTLKINSFSFEEVFNYIEATFLEKIDNIDDIEDIKNWKRRKIFMYLVYFINWIQPMTLINSSEFNNCEYNETIKNYKKLISWFYEYLEREGNERPKRINVFTTNYDLLFEKTFDDFLLKNPLIYFNDGSRGVFKKYVSNKNFYLNLTHSGYSDNYKREIPIVNLFKLHGSISWELWNMESDASEIMVSEKNQKIEEIQKIINKLFKDLENVKKEITELLSKKNKNKNVLELISSLSELIENKLEDNVENDKNLEQFWKKYSELLIIDPNKHKFWKTVAEQHYYQSIRSFSYELEKQNTILIVFAFSFADEHIREIFKRSLLNPSLHVFLICFDKDDQKKLKKLFNENQYKNISFLPEFSNKNNRNDTLKGNFTYLLSLLDATDE